MMKPSDRKDLEPNTRQHSFKLPTHHDGTHHCAPDTHPPSPPPPASPFGCSCFFLPSPRRERKLKTVSKGNLNSCHSEAVTGQATAWTIDGGRKDEDEDDRWHFVLEEIGSQQVDAGGLFDVKKAERDFRRASLKEKQLTQEAHKLLDMVAKGSMSVPS